MKHELDADDLSQYVYSLLDAQKIKLALIKVC